MSHERQIIGNCPKCNSDHFSCSYNHFEKDDLAIDSWEHKCPNCGFRETTAFRSDEENPKPGNIDPCVCPYCARRPS